MGRKCGVADCLSDSSRSEDVGVTFHKVPMHPDIRPKWMTLCRIPEDRQMMKVIYICSRHFLTADFCNFKGKKYMLRQGVLPSVFPWNKGKVSKKSSSSTSTPKIKKEPIDKKTIKEEKKEFGEEIDIKPSISELSTTQIKEEVLSPPAISTIEEQKVLTLNTPTGLLTFTPDEKIEALDFNQTWVPARIIEVDYQENEVLVHFEPYSNKYDEWISMNSNTLRAVQTPEITLPPEEPKIKPPAGFEVGERCMATWSDSRKFPATVTKKLEDDSYEVRFDDGFVKVLKSHKINNCQVTPMQSSPLFDASKVSKQERRDRKRKLDIPALFGKRQRASSQEKDILSPTEEIESWNPSWKHGRPIGEESALETSDGLRKSIIVPDPRIPQNWTKHLSQRVNGASAGKWDTFIVNPDGRKFRSRAELRIYLEENPHLKLSEALFDFSLYRKSRPKPRPVIEEPPPIIMPEPEIEEPDPNSLKIPMVDNAYKCPIEGCGKNFRRENLAQMHVKHYHPEYTKFLDSTPNVADLAYARTVGESLDRSPGFEKRVPARQSIKSSTPKTATPKLSQSPSVDETKPLAPKKDQEIIKLLNSKPIDNIKQEILPNSPQSFSPLPTEIKREPGSNTPKRDELGFRQTKPPGGGIRTLLPVIRPSEIKMEDYDIPKPSKQIKRKRVASELVEPVKPKEELPPVPAEPSNVIIEGGEVIKIVRMKREEIINCTCGITEEDGLMIQCELCLCWQHAYCNNIERENQVPEKYICYICQNPIRQRTSKKYFHDQDWLKHGTMPVGSYHCKDEEVLQKRFDKLKQTHDLSGGMLELKSFMHTMKMKMKIAEAKNHPKLYLWSKPWDKPSLPEKEIKVKEEETHDDSMLFSLLKADKDVKLKHELPEFSKLDISSLIDNNLDNVTPVPIIPQPEAAIESDDCRLNLLDHIAHCQSLIDERMDDFEKQLDALDIGLSVDEDPETCPRTRQTTEMMMRDLNTLNEFSQITSF